MRRGSQRCWGGKVRSSQPPSPAQKRVGWDQATHVHAPMATPRFGLREKPRDSALTVLPTLQGPPAPQRSPHSHTSSHLVPFLSGCPWNNLGGFCPLLLDSRAPPAPHQVESPDRDGSDLTSWPPAHSAFSCPRSCLHTVHSWSVMVSTRCPKEK